MSKPRKMTPEEVSQMQQLYKMVKAEHFIADQIAENTVLVPRGQEVAAERKATARILENFNNNWVSTLLHELGYPSGENVNIDLATGEIKRVV